MKLETPTDGLQSHSDDIKEHKVLSFCDQRDTYFNTVHQTNLIYTRCKRAAYAHAY